MATIVNNRFVFNPTEITGCRLWLDANDPASITYSSGTSVSQWNDKSGYRNNVSQSTASNQPTISSNYVNGRSAMLFTPNQWVQGNISIETYTRFLVYSNSVVNVGAAVMDGAGFLQNGGGTTYQDSVGYFNPPPSFQTGSFFRIAEAYFPVTGGTSGRIWIDGTEYTSLPFYAPVGNYPSSYVAFGRRGDGIYFTGAVAEAILFNRSLTTSEMNMMEGYLAYKYGLQSRLPSNHPYRTAIVQTTLPNQAFSIPNSIFVDWSPSQVSGLSLWLDGADPNGTGVPPANGANLSSWKDKSGNNISVTASTNKPTFSQNSLNGLGTIRFNGSSGTQYYFNTAAFSFGTSQRAAFFVIQNTGPASGAASVPHWFWPNTGNGANALSFNGWIDTNVQGTQGLQSYTVSKNVFLIFSLQFGNTSSVGETFNNGTSRGTFTKTSGGSSFADATSGYGIGAIPADATGLYFFDGNIAEILLFNTSISNTQREQIEAYLALKWGLQPNLPNSHPYKNVVPIKSGIAVNSLTTMTQGLWTPRRVTGLQLWLDATDINGNGTSVTTGTTITSWKDKSGNGNHVTGSSGTTTYLKNGINKNGSVFFNSSYFTGGFNSTFNGTTIYSFIVASINSSSTQFSRLLSLGRPGVNDFDSASTGIPFVRNTGLNQLYAANNNVATAKFTITYGSPFLSQSYFNATTAAINLNGSSFNTTATTCAFNLTSYGLGINTNTSDIASLYVGEICEVLCYFGNSLSTSQAQQVEGYLAWKWGLQTSLPSTHPFAKWPPPP